MQSAYMVLGVPGNASPQDIEAAYQTAVAFFTKERLVADPSLLNRREQVQEAYKVLSNPALRQAHDRKLSAAARPVVVTVQPVEHSPMRKLAPLALVCVALLGGGQWWANKREAQRQQALVLEQQTKQLEAQRAAEEATRLAEEEKDKRRKQLEDEARERQLRRDTQYASQQTQYTVNQQLQYQRQLTQEEERARRQAKQEEAQRQREAEYAAQKQQTRDQTQLRNLCIINYGRPNC
ncbi:hypothetical protein RQP54_05750 [Curvibacter sp. APW13]|uniref:hypothetical protein n=1 Tax=Curvibacter sp. APW13 TaxID=3077236 RepID=UPI0028DF0BA6|nr:hypothetical protein [Curvibacter sp. APW13]MDT8990365.1 hypothetical protein [Curvibacter sp. APW13]